MDAIEPAYGTVPLLLVALAAVLLLLTLILRFKLHAFIALVLVSLAQFLFSLFGPANTILMMQDRERYSAYGMGVYVLALFICSRLLLPIAGITGGALAILISSFLYNVLLNVWVYRFYGMVTPFLSFPIKRR